jgi:hypothetical protein
MLRPPLASAPKARPLTFLHFVAFATFRKKVYFFVRRNRRPSVGNPAGFPARSLFIFGRFGENLIPFPQIFPPFQKTKRYTFL